MTKRTEERAGCRKDYCQACEEAMPVDILTTKVYFAGTDHPLVFRLCPVCVEFDGVPHHAQQACRRRPCRTRRA